MGYEISSLLFYVMIYDIIISIFHLEPNIIIVTLNQILKGHKTSITSIFLYLVQKKEC